MSIRACSLLAIEGAQGSGKTTLVHALAARLRERGDRVATVEEATRDSIYFENAVLHGEKVDIFTELHILASLIQREHERARHHDILVCDRSIVNVIAYSRLLLDSHNLVASELMQAMTQFCSAYGRLYDLVAYLQDSYATAFDNDPFRNDEKGGAAITHRVTADHALRDAYRDASVPLELVPQGLSTAEKVSWLEELLARHHLIRSANN